MSIRLGFYVCHCGINIAGKVRVEEVAAFTRELKNVVIARDYKFMCSDPGQEMIEKDIKKFDLTGLWWPPVRQDFMRRPFRVLANGPGSTHIFSKWLRFANKFPGLPRMKMRLLEKQKHFRLRRLTGSITMKASMPER